MKLELKINVDLFSSEYALCDNAMMEMKMNKNSKHTRSLYNGLKAVSQNEKACLIGKIHVEETCLKNIIFKKTQLFIQIVLEYISIIFYIIFQQFHVFKQVKFDFNFSFTN